MSLEQQIKDDIHRRIDEKFRRGQGHGGLLPGMVLIVIGSLVLLDHMGILSVDRIWRFWPLLLITLGIYKLFEGCNRVFGVLLLLVGSMLLLNNLGYTRMSLWDLWPIALIGIGLAVIWNRFELPKLQRAGPGGPNSINESAVFGGVQRRIHVSNFVGGNIAALFGGVEVDFRSADIEGEEAVLYIEAVFGGIEVTIPDRWLIHWEGQNIFGGYSDETRPPLPDVPGAPPKKRLVLRGHAIFGGITVRS